VSGKASNCSSLGVMGLILNISSWLEISKEQPNPLYVSGMPFST
jgi:hypothetical protein